jgi:SSS family solute:Na+ symporter
VYKRQAETDRDARLGSIAAGFLKLLIPFFSIGAGTAAFYLFKIRYGADAIKPDDTFLTLLKTVVPMGYGFVGLILAGLMCAIFSAIYSMMNSVSTMMAFDIYKKYIRPDALDKWVVRFGQGFVFVMCAIAAFLAYASFDPKSSDNFFLRIANQTSYIKPGLVVAFFWGILWRKTHPIAAVIALLGAPLVGLFCDYLYANFLTHIPFVRDTFGVELNFLYRVFAITVLDSLILVLVSILLNKKIPLSTEAQSLTIEFGSIRKAIIRGALIHVPLISLVLFQVLSPQVAAFPAALLTLLLFVWYWKTTDSEVPFYKSDICYAGILTGSMAFIMYYFA